MFYGDETHLTFYETLFFSLLAMSAKLIIFNAIKSSMKSPLRLVWWTEGITTLILCRLIDFSCRFGAHEWTRFHWLTLEKIDKHVATTKESLCCSIAMWVMIVMPLEKSRIHIDKGFKSRFTCKVHTIASRRHAN